MGILTEPWRQVHRSAALVLLIVAAGGAQADAVHTLVDAQFVLSDSGSPPGDGADWVDAPLPDFWRLADPSRRGHELGWYRLQLTLADLPGELPGIYLPRLSMNAAVYLNGDLLGTGGRMSPPVARNWNRPLLFEAPRSLWRTGENVIHVKLRVSPQGAGVLAPIDVGPMAVLRESFTGRVLRQNLVSVGLFAITLTLAVFMLALWVRLREETKYLLFGLSALAWSVYSLNQFISWIPVSVSAWWVVVHTAIDLWIVLLAMFAHRFTGLRRPRTEAAMLAYVAAGIVLYGALTPADSFNRMNVYWHLGTNLIGVYVVVLLTRHWQRVRTWEVAAFALMMAALVGFGARDWYMNSGLNPQMWLDNFHTLHFVAPVAFLVLGWHLTGRFIRALRGTRRLNAELQGRVDEARAELEAAYTERTRLERERAAAEERERMMSDLHDDVGARLLSLLHQADSEASASLARSALEEMRRIVSRPVADARCLSGAISAIEVESRERLGAAGIALDWDADTGLELQDWPAERAGQLVRVLREAVSNVLRHARATRVCVRIARDGDALTIVIADDGAGQAAGPVRPGRGIRNMRSRVEGIGGTIEWRWLPGCRVAIRLPCLPAASSSARLQIGSPQLIPSADASGLRCSR